MTRRRIALIAGIAVAATAVAVLVTRRSGPLVLTGIVTTHDVIVSPQVAGTVHRLLVSQGDSVRRDQVLALLDPDELQADLGFYAHSAQASASQVRVSEADLRYQQVQAAQQVQQAEATLAAAIAQDSEAVASAKNAKRTLDRLTPLLAAGAVSPQAVDSARTAYDVARARADAASQEVDAQRAAARLAHAAVDQVAARRDALRSAQQQHAAATAQVAGADVRLAHAQLRAPIAGIVDVDAVRAGEYVTPGQPVLTLIDPDSLWVRADVEETYIDRIRLGDTLTVRLPSGAERPGVVFFRGVDADFATQRDVSRTKRDIRTFEIRLRVDNRDRRLAVGMTAYVLLPRRYTTS